MDVGALRTLALSAAFNTFGVPALLTPPGGSTISAIGVWTTPLVEDLPAGHDFARREPRRVLAFRIAQTRSIPLGTTIVAAERGGASRTWKVDGIERQDGEQIRVLLRPA
ncbi:MAG TPA: hypothetical protein VNR64_07610 [Vicinamibacterales bacterium]|nr:hypothetical protein [Vicinamibacterales bacterium]